MTLEVAILDVIPQEKTQFESTFKIAEKIIQKQKGYIKHELKKNVKKSSRYILLVEWETIEDHEIGFRKSTDYLEWKALLHHYYDPFPVVEHYV